MEKGGQILHGLSEPFMSIPIGEVCTHKAEVKSCLIVKLLF